MNEMLKNATQFVDFLAKQEGTANEIKALKKHLKHFSKNELVRLCTATLIAKNILEEKVKKLETDSKTEHPNP